DILRQNQKTIQSLLDWRKEQKHSHVKFHLIHSPSLPKKHAGVGLARKIVMDEAAWRFSTINKDTGVIVCLDADCMVGKNYLSGIENHFQKNPYACPKDSGLL